MAMRSLPVPVQTPQGQMALPQLLRLACLAGAMIGALAAVPAAQGGGLEGLALLSPRHVEKMEELNRELGKLCSKPPPQALPVCRLHARLVYTR
jgi:hypothetical protein